MPRKTARPAADAARSTGYQFTITLRDTEPRIWRRIRIAEGTLEDLHAAIQAAMGWSDKHRHFFQIGDRRFGRPGSLGDQPFSSAIDDSTRVTLAEVLPADGSPLRFGYVYDMGDRWEHDILYEGPVDVPATACLDGGRACPPEDCGGVGGFEYLLEILGDPDHREHLDFVESMGNYDPDDFDPRWASARMTSALRPRYPRAS